MAGIAARNEAKAKLLYGGIDSSQGFYVGEAAARDRSLMNVTFKLPEEPLDRQFLVEAQQAGLYGLEGHRTRGGLRASLYNAVTLESVQALCAFMGDFRSRHASHQSR